jgi:NTE family protein
MTGSEAWVFGGGGVAGIAWITGMLAGFADAGRDTGGAGLVVGTSAGAAVAAQVTSGLPIEELYQRQHDPAKQATEIVAVLDVENVGAEFAALLDGVTSPEDASRRLGSFALKADTVSEAERRAVIESRLPVHQWPEQRLLLVAVDAESGEPRLFDRDSGADLVDAVAASCAVPGVWPPVSIRGRRYVDGGVRSADNADLAARYARVIVLSPFGTADPFPWTVKLDAVAEELRAGGTRVDVFTPDEASTGAIGTNPLDPATRTPAAEAGRAQGLREAARLE